MWQRCPRSWYFRYVLGKKMRPSGAMIEGSCYHSALEVNFKQKIVTRVDLPIEECLASYSDAWEARIKGEPEIDWEDKTPGALKDEGVQLVRAYMGDISPGVQPIEVEKPYVDTIARVPIVSVLDLVDEKEKVIDHKTAARMYLQDDVDKDGQMTTYAFMRKKAIIGEFHVAIKPTKTLPARAVILRTFRTIEHVNWWKEMVEGIISQMKTGIAPPNPIGYHCSPRFCGYWKLCRGHLP